MEKKQINRTKEAKLRASDLISHLIKISKTKEAKQRKEVSLSFFKTKKGQYAEHECFLGISVVDLRLIVKDYYHLSLKEIKKLLLQPAHEIRFAALLILIRKYEEAKREEIGEIGEIGKIGKKEETRCIDVDVDLGVDIDENISDVIKEDINEEIKEEINKDSLVVNREKIVKFYLNNTKGINNWDLVDVSAHKILGDFLLDKKETETDSVLLKLASSKNIWERRIAIVSTWSFIREGSKRETFIITEKLINDQEDLIHKACGWMLREVGKRVSEKDLEIFLHKHIKNIPRITLRYALEKFAKNKRMYYYSLGKG